MISNELLKNKILDAAIHGKLVDNDLSLPSLDVEEITEDIPFEIPSNWKWTKLSNVFDVKGGKRIPKGKTFIDSGEHIYIRVADMENMSINTNHLKYIDEDTYSVIKNYIITEDDLYITVAGTIGSVGSVPGILNNMNLTENADRLIPKGVNKEFYKFVLNSQYYQSVILSNTTKAAQPKLAIKRINDIELIVPPLEEQQRIVNKIEELFELIDNKTKNDQEKDRLKVLLKDKILDSAIHGELVDNGLSLPALDIEELTEDIPFEIPSNWKWTTFGMAALKITDGTHSTPKYVSAGIPFLSVKDMSDGKLSLNNCKYITREEHDILYKRCDPRRNDLLITKVGTTGVPVVVNTDEEFSLFVSVALLRFDLDKYCVEYLKHVVNSNFIQNIVAENTKGMANKNWVIKEIAKTPIPIPPLEEQQRIVVKIEECFDLIDKL